MYLRLEEDLKKKTEKEAVKLEFESTAEFVRKVLRDYFNLKKNK